MYNQKHDIIYLELLNTILHSGNRKQDRTNTGTISIFGEQLKFNLSDGSIPLLTTKKMHWPSIIHELLWYISGSTNNNDLEANNVRIWREWADSNGDLGPLYGRQLRKWGGSHDQLQYIIDQLRSNPDSRRMVVSYWDPTILPYENIEPKLNPALGKQALAPCHYSWEVYTRELSSKEIDNNFGKTRAMSLKLNMRSIDMFLGAPFNIAQYSILLHMLCHITNMVPEFFVWSGGDAHIYTNHIEQVHKQIKREPFHSPGLLFARDITNINDFTFEDFILVDYNSHSTLSGKVAV
jgi:thymidylate synthase